MFTDTHTHPYLSENPNDFVRRAVSAGVNRLIVPAVNTSSLLPMADLAVSFPENIRLAFGLHPTEVTPENVEPELHSLTEALDNSPYAVAVGEIGIDQYWDKTFRDLQMITFDRQLSEAEKRGLPVIIHCREAFAEVMEVLSDHKKVKCVFHSFGGTQKEVEEIISTGDNWYIGINGIVTFKNSKLKDVIPAIPADRLLLETDSPYLAPVPHRGKPNESSYLPYIAATIAQASGDVPVAQIAHITAQNSLRLFGF